MTIAGERGLSAFDREQLVAMIREAGLIGLLDAIAVVCELVRLQHLYDEDQRETDLWSLRRQVVMDAADLGRAIMEDQRVAL